MHKDKHQAASPHNGENDSIPSKPAASFRCNRFLVRAFRLVLRTRECLSPFATKRTNGVQGSSCTSDSHCLVLISPFSYLAFHSVVLYSLQFIPPSLYPLRVALARNCVSSLWLASTVPSAKRSYKIFNRTVENASTSQKHHPFSPLNTATLPSTVTTPKTVEAG
jgi:hypothetical protein